MPEVTFEELLQISESEGKSIRELESQAQNEGFTIRKVFSSKRLEGMSREEKQSFLTQARKDGFEVEFPRTPLSSGEQIALGAAQTAIPPLGLISGGNPSTDLANFFLSEEQQLGGGIQDVAREDISRNAAALLPTLLGIGGGGIGSLAGPGGTAAGFAGGTAAGAEILSRLQEENPASFGQPGSQNLINPTGDPTIDTLINEFGLEILGFLPPAIVKGARDATVSFGKKMVSEFGEETLQAAGNLERLGRTVPRTTVGSVPENRVSRLVEGIAAPVKIEEAIGESTQQAQKLIKEVFGPDSLKGTTRADIGRTFARQVNVIGKEIPAGKNTQQVINQAKAIQPLRQNIFETTNIIDENLARMRESIPESKVLETPPPITTTKVSPGEVQIGDDILSFADDTVSTQRRPAPKPRKTDLNKAFKAFSDGKATSAQKEQLLLAFPEEVAEVESQREVLNSIPQEIQKIALGEVDEVFDRVLTNDRTLKFFTSEGGETRRIFRKEGLSRIFNAGQDRAANTFNAQKALQFFESEKNQPFRNRILNRTEEKNIRDALIVIRDLVPTVGGIGQIVGATRIGNAVVNVPISLASSAVASGQIGRSVLAQGIRSGGFLGFVTGLNAFSRQILLDPQNARFLTGLADRPPRSLTQQEAVKLMQIVGAAKGIVPLSNNPEVGEPERIP